MEALTIENLVYEFVKSRKRWVRGGEIEDAAHGWGHMASTALRKARLLAENGKLVRREIDGKVEYTAFSDNKQKQSLGVFFNKNQKKLF